MNSARPGQRALERLHHFQCPHCAKWWSIADADATRTRWFCPWCGILSEYALPAEIFPTPELDSPNE